MHSISISNMGSQVPCGKLRQHSTCAQIGAELVTVQSIGPVHYQIHTCIWLLGAILSVGMSYRMVPYSLEGISVG